MDHKIVSVEEAAATRGVDPRVVRYWCDKGYLPNARRLGRDWAILAKDLEGFEPPKPGPVKGSKRTPKEVQDAVG